MNTSLADKRNCFGCMACMDACPAQAIQTAMGDDTFIYPKIDAQKCILCGRCEQTCRIVHDFSGLRKVRYSVAAKSKNGTCFSQSTSGGAFSVICGAIRNKYGCDQYKYYVVGAVYDSNLHVHSKIVEYIGFESLAEMRTSKYIQCDTTGIYAKVEQILSDNHSFVIFSGTPCQIAALKAFLGFIPNNLFTIDLICKGAPSQYQFDKYIHELEDKYNSKVVKYTFRTKEKLDNGTYYGRSARIEFDNGRVLRLSRLEDDYLRAFYSSLPVFKSSCLTCKFKSVNRIGDISIGDAWGADRLFPNLKPLTGLSLILFNSNKGCDLVNHIESDMYFWPISLDEIARDNSFAPHAIDDSDCHLGNLFRNDTMSYSECLRLGEELKNG